MAQGVQVFAALSFLVIGLSHIFQARAWVAYFQTLVAKGTTGAFFEGFLLLNFGAFIAAFHNVWHGPEIVLTLVGWTQLIKGAVRFVAPTLALRVMARMTMERAWQIQASGGFALALSAFFWWLRFRVHT